jgi:hypothetical protein
VHEVDADDDLEDDRAAAWISPYPSCMTGYTPEPEERAERAPLGVAQAVVRCAVVGLRAVHAESEEQA